MAFKTGRAAILRVETAANTYTDIAYVQSKNLDTENEAVTELIPDKTSPEGKLGRTILPGSKTYDFSFAGVYDPADASAAKLEDIADSTAPSEKFQIDFPTGKVYTGTFHLQAFRRTGEAPNGFLKFTCDLLDMGDVAKAASALT